MTEPRVYCLCRVSSGESVVSNISIPVQKAAARKFKSENLRQMKWGESCFPEDETPGFFVDRAVSAWKHPFNKRPASSALLKVLRPGDYLLIYSVDRGFRNVRDFGTTVGKLIEAGVNVRFVVNEGVNFSTAVGKLVGNMLASIAQYSSDIKSERTREAKAMRKLGLVKSKPARNKQEDECHWGDGDFVTPEEFFAKDDEPAGGTVYPYIRCSHVSSLESGLGLASQEQKVLAYSKSLCERNPSLSLAPIHEDDAVSAFKVPFAKRPSGKEIIEQIKPGDHLVVYRLDRAWRSVRDCAEMVDEFTKRGIHIHLVADGVSTDSPMGKIHFYTMSFMAWIESHFLSVRGKQVAKHLRSKGRPVARRHRGFKTKKAGSTKRLVIDPEEIARHKWVYELKQKTGMSRDALSLYIEQWEAREQNRPVRPVSPRADRVARYWTPNRIYGACKAYEKLLKLAEANNITIPDPQELHSRGRLIKTPS